MMITVVTSLRMSIMVLLGRSFRCCLCWLRLWRSCTHPNTTCGSCRDTGLSSDTANTAVARTHTHPPPHVRVQLGGPEAGRSQRGGFRWTSQRGCFNLVFYKILSLPSLDSVSRPDVLSRQNTRYKPSHNCQDEDAHLTRLAPNSHKNPSI